MISSLQILQLISVFIGAFIGAFYEDWTAFCCFITALIVNGIYLIDERIKELKK